jgi:hypothetical protein
MFIKRSFALLFILMFWVTGIVFSQNKITNVPAAGQSGPDAASIPDISAKNLPAATGDAQKPAQTTNNLLKVSDAAGGPGFDVVVKVLASMDKAFVGIQFDLLFDSTKLQIKKAVCGVDSTGLSAVGIDSAYIAKANGNGKLTVAMVDFSLASPVVAGANKELFLVTFTVKAGATGSSPVTLDKVTVSDAEAKAVEVNLAGGTVTFSVPGDADGNGKIDIFDLLQLLKILGGSAQSTGGADVDSNGKIDIFDLLALLKKLASG